MRRLTVLLGVPTLAAALLAASPSVANAAETACTPAPASAVADFLGIDQLHASGLDGAGLTIGVISTSYNNYDPALGSPATTAPVDVASGALPGAGNPCGHTQEVEVINDDAPNDDEGRAMLQIVHAIAPAADLVFTTGAGGDDLVTGDQAMADAIDSMVAAGVDVIVDDIMEEGDLAFASGFAATAAQRATDAGVIYTVAAGNLNVVGVPVTWNGEQLPSVGHSIGSWQTTEFRATTCPQAIIDSDTTKTFECMDFDPSAAVDNQATYWIYPYSGLAADARTAMGFLEWGDAPYAVTSAFSAYFLDADEAIVATDVIANDPTSPYAVAGNTDLFAGLAVDTLVQRNLVIAREVRESNRSVPVRFSFFDDNDPNVVVAAEYYESTETDTIGSSLVGRAANPSSVTVAAASMQRQPLSLDTYSGIGPQVRYFGAFDVGEAPSPLEVPVRKEGPTITGLDVIPTTFFSVPVDGGYLYPGTSAATPVIGATLALAKQSAPNASNEHLIGALTATATPLAETWTGTVPAQTSGAGIVNPTALIAAVREAPPAPAPVPDPAAPARLPDTGASTEGGIWAFGLMLLGLAGVAAARIRRSTRSAA
ncbi:S8 family serine peptidase [Agromyces silvae]|uniref:S8 family serine peptidase n=1 Tax=Agromyces silvae TaxID=3388266 RepID=UPI00280A72B9|nr:S8 family serine peptidase [Agromyces protaetiae]